MIAFEYLKIDDKTVFLRIVVIVVVFTNFDYFSSSTPLFIEKCLCAVDLRCNTSDEQIGFNFYPVSVHKRIFTSQNT